jgi:zinc/manganese transport system ATP-binding protein
VIGTPDEVITADQLSALYGIPIEVLHDRAGHLFVVGQHSTAPTQTAEARA